MSRLFINNNSLVKLLSVFLSISVFLGTFCGLYVLAGQENEIWDGTVAASFETGTGSETDPYIISKGSELAFAISSSVDGAYYKLSNDIYLNDVSNSDWASNSSNNEWLSVKNFKGHLDGDGHIVYGVWYPANNADYTVGLIPVLQSSGSVKNIGVCNSVIVGQIAGAIVGMCKSNTLKTISCCFSDESVTVEGSENAAGILGYAGCATKGAEVTIQKMFR